MKIKLWGVRGSLPASLTNEDQKEKYREILQRAVKEEIFSDEKINDFLGNLPFHLSNTYGGDTTCVEVIAGEKNKRFIIDAGTGIRRLGDLLIKEKGFGQGGKKINLFLTHTHWDHIQGFPFFVPAYIPGNIIRFFSPYENMKERLERQQIFENFPVPLNGMPSTKEFHTISPEQTLSMGDVKIKCFPLNHPGGSFAYRFEENGKVFIFATDAEFTMTQLDQIDDYRPFFQEADILVLDSQYTLEEAFYKFDWGHTSFSMAVNLGITWNIKKLVLTHHDPAYTDEKLFQIYEDALMHQKHMGNEQMEIVMALQGDEFIL